MRKITRDRIYNINRPVLIKYNGSPIRFSQLATDRELVLFHPLIYIAQIKLT